MVEEHQSQLINGWQVNGIATLLSGFPFTPQIGSNRSGDGDTRNPDRPNAESGVQRAGDHRKSESVVQSERVHVCRRREPTAIWAAECTTDPAWRISMFRCSRPRA